MWYDLAFGEYNDLVREAAGVRGQILVNWDFEWALSLNLKGEEILISLIVKSSGDSMGASVAQQKANLDQLLATHPNNVLSLEHETLGVYKSPYFLIYGH